MLGHDVVLKHDEVYLVGSAVTDGSGEQAGGLYRRDTRFLHRFETRLNGLALRPLSVRTLGPDSALIVSGNEPFSIVVDDASVSIPPLTISLEQHLRLDTALHVRLVVRSYWPDSLPLTLSIDLGADFRDLFDLRGFPPPDRPGKFIAPVIGDDQIRFAYRDATGATAATRITFDRRLPTTFDGTGALPQETDAGSVPAISLTFPLHLRHGGTWEITATITSEPPPTPARVRQHHPHHIPATGATLATEPAPRTGHVVTSDPAVNGALDQAAVDLDMLQTTFPDGAMPSAGVPWFVAPFGRDSLIVGLQTLHLAPKRAAGTLRVLAALQGEVEDQFREEQPGKILHEMRYGELARLSEIPHTPYYGSVDATPLFVLLFAETVAWTGDDRLFDDLLPNVERALDWIERYGDRDGDGLIEYLAVASDDARIVHQVWKDSHDSLHQPDGRPVAAGPITPVEVQGYLFAAYTSLANLLAARGHQDRAATLRQRAGSVRQAVEEHFWMPEDGFYAQALDPDKRQVRAISSNPGHLLACGLPDPERGRKVVARMRQPDLDAGWGIRTLSTEMPAYNPMSYHNGSIWPHDNSLIASGMRRYGQAEDANRIASALIAAATSDPLNRLPELYAGFPRHDASARAAPVAYPVSCSPQAWAAAALPLLVRTMLGLDIDQQREVATVAPALPNWLQEVTLRDLTVRGHAASVTVRRTATGYDIATEGPIEPR